MLLSIRWEQRALSPWETGCRGSAVSAQVGISIGTGDPCPDETLAADPWRSEPLKTTAAQHPHVATPGSAIKLHPAEPPQKPHSWMTFTNLSASQGHKTPSTQPAHRRPGELGALLPATAPGKPASHGVGVRTAARREGQEPTRSKTSAF